MHRRTVLAVLGTGVLGGLAGCSGSTGDETPSPTGGPTDAATETPPSTATTTSTPTATPAATTTTSPTPSPTPTATTTPEPDVRAIGDWARIRAGEYRFDLKVTTWRDTAAIEPDELKSDYDDSSLWAPENERWVIVTVKYRERAGRQPTLDPEQWTMTDFRDITRTPDAEAMREAADTLPDETVLPPSDAPEYYVIFSTPWAADLTFTMTPFRDADYRSVRWV